MTRPVPTDSTQLLSADAIVGGDRTHLRKVTLKGATANI
jgi:hypothetical protein